jgi:hypothetical protein
MRYFKFTYADVDGVTLLSSDEAFYFTNAETNVDEMKAVARAILRKPHAVVTVHNIQEISKEFYETKTGKFVE